MSATFQLQVLSEEKKPVFLNDYSKRVEIGRQDRGEPAPYSHRFEGDHWRVVIAPLTEDTVPRHYLSIDPIAEGFLRIRNASKAIPIRFMNGEELRPGEAREMPLPIQLMLGRRTIWVVPPETISDTFQELPDATIPPGQMIDGLATRMAGLSLPMTGTDPRVMIAWLKSVMHVLQAEASSPDFFELAAEAAAEMVGLDSASVWLHREGEWVQEAYWTLPTARLPTKVTASRLVLNRVLQRAKTLWDKPDGSSTTTASLDSIAAVVAAPILNREGKVIGALYGDRSFLSPLSRQRGEITEVQATLIELLASGIAAGLERLKHEQAAVAARVRFEQFFTPDLARELERKPDLLEGRECEVTLLFCDIRGFSRISENLGPKLTVDWINDVMGVLSDCVLAHNGVLVDYIGDELMAMWGAPTAQPDHAGLACKAALDMLASLPALSDKWEATLGEPLDLGIGLNTGPARVGNTGTKRKFKYGPLGNTVNLASRVQGATKHFKSRLLITGATKASLDEGFLTRRLGKVRVVNIELPVDLYELAPPESPGFPTLQASYEAALANFENENFRPAAMILATLQTDFSSDGPCLLLLARVVNAMCDPATFEPVWTLGSK